MGNLFFFSGSVTAFFIALLLSKKGKGLCDWLLALWLLIILFHILVSYISLNNPHTFLLEISSAAVFLNGPVLWLYTKSLFHKEKAFSRYSLLHFLPFAIHLAIVIPYISHTSLAPLSAFVRATLAWAKLASILVYCLVSAAEIKRSQKVAEENLSNIEVFHVKWLQFAIYSVVVVWCIGLVSQFAFQAGLFHFNSDREDLAIQVAVSLFVIVLGYYGFKQAPVFVDDLATRQLEGEKRPPEGSDELLQERYKKSAIDPEEVKSHAYRLDDLMQKEKLFADAELSLNKLADRMNLSPNQLSQVINQHYSKNFFELVNTYRVGAVIGMLQSGAIQTSTLFGIGLDAGFNSKASFNRYFKKHTGKTPSEYLKEMVPPSTKP